LEGDDIPGVPVAIAPPPIMKDAQVHDGADVPAAEDVFHLLAAHVDLVMDDVFGPVRKRAPIDPDHLVGPMELAREELAEAPAHPGDQHRAFEGGLGPGVGGRLGLWRLLHLLRQLVRVPEHAAGDRRPGRRTLLNGLTSPARAGFVTA
jgi:hypothetical protein